MKRTLLVLTLLTVPLRTGTENCRGPNGEQKAERRPSNRPWTNRRCSS